MPLDLGKIKKRQKETETKSRGGFFKPQEGKNTIRVFTFDHEVTKEDVKAGLFDKAKLGKKVTELDRPVMRFFPGGGKPVMAKEADIASWRKKMDRADKTEQAKLRQSGPQQHWMLNIVDTSADEQRIVEFAANKTIYNAILEKVLDPEFGEDVLGCEGRDFIVTYDPKKEGAAKYSISLRDEKKSEKLPESLEEQVKDYYDADVYAALGGDAEVAAEEEDDDEEEEEDDDEKDEADSEDEDVEEEDDDDSDDEDEDEESDDDEEEDDEDDLDEEEDEEPKKSAKKAVSKKGKKK